MASSPLISEIDENARGNHDEVYKIENESENRKRLPIARSLFRRRADFAYDAADVADGYQQSERDAGAFGGTRFIGAHNIERPGNPETKYHTDFENCCKCTHI